MASIRTDTDTTISPDFTGVQNEIKKTGAAHFTMLGDRPNGSDNSLVGNFGGSGDGDWDDDGNIIDNGVTLTINRGATVVADGGIKLETARSSDTGDGGILHVQGGTLVAPSINSETYNSTNRFTLDTIGSARGTLKGTNEASIYMNGFGSGSHPARTFGGARFGLRLDLEDSFLFFDNVNSGGTVRTGVTYELPYTFTVSGVTQSAWNSATAAQRQLIIYCGADAAATRYTIQLGTITGPSGDLAVNDLNNLLSDALSGGGGSTLTVDSFPVLDRVVLDRIAFLGASGAIQIAQAYATDDEARQVGISTATSFLSGVTVTSDNPEYSSGTAESFFGTNRSIAYLGVGSRIVNSRIEGMDKIEFQGPFEEFSNTQLVFGGTGDLDDAGFLYIGADEYIDTDITGLVTTGLESGLTLPNGYMYSTITSQGGRMRFLGSIPSTTRCFELGFNLASGQDAAGNFKAMEFYAPLTAAVQRQSSTGTLTNSSGGVVMWDNQHAIAASQSLTGGAVSNATRYKWYQLNKLAFTGSGNSSFTVPIGFPDSRGNAAVMKYFSALTGKNTQVNTIRTNTNKGTAITGTVDSSQSASNKASTYRAYPMAAAAYDWGYTPYISPELGTTDTFSAGNPNITQVDAADASADAIRNGYEVNGILAEETIFTGNTNFDTYAEAAALVGATPSQVSASNYRLDVTSTRSLEQMYARTAAYVHETMSTDTATYTVPAQGGTRPTYTNGDAPSTLTANRIGLYTTRLTQTTNAALNTAADDTNFEDLRGIAFGSSIATDVNGANWGYIGLFRDTTNWGIYEYKRPGFAFTYSSLNLTAGDLVPLVTRGNLGSADSTQLRTMTFGQSEDMLGLTIANTRVQFLRTQGLPMTRNGNTLQLNGTLIAQGASTSVTTTTNIDTVDLDTGSSWGLGSNDLDVSVTATRLGAGESNPIVSGFRAGGTDDCIGSSVTVGSNVTLQFTGGQTYLVAGDISAATLVRTGSGDATLVAVGNGNLGTGSESGIVRQQDVELTFAYNSAQTDWTTSETFDVVNVQAYQLTSGTYTLLTQPTPTVNSTANTISYTYRIPLGSTVEYAFAARRARAGQWYDPVFGSASSSTTVTLVDSETSVVPTAVASSDTGASTIDTWFNTQDRVAEVTGALSNSVRLTINVPNTATILGTNSVRYIVRKMMQQDHFLEAIARGRLEFSDIRILADRIEYANDIYTFINWQKTSTSTARVKFDLQAITSTQANASAGITTTDTGTLVEWSGPQNIGVLSDQQAADLATNATVWAAKYS